MSRSPPPFYEKIYQPPITPRFDAHIAIKRSDIQQPKL